MILTKRQSRCTNDPETLTGTYVRALDNNTNMLYTKVKRIEQYKNNILRSLEWILSEVEKI
jgi:hypothetical protein